MKSRVPLLQPIISFELIILLIISTIRPLSAQVIPIGQTYSSDTIFQPFTSGVPVYSLHLYGSIQLYSDSSLVRVVLVDSYGNHLLVYESYPLITDTNSFSIIAGCDETCFLNGIIPDSLRIDIISAFCTIDSLKVDTNYVSDVFDLQAQAKWDVDSIKISVMNNRIREEHMYWRAGLTNFSLLSFSEKDDLFGNKFNIQGYDYYCGGHFRLYSKRNNPYLPCNSMLVESFDWRTRHDADTEDSKYYDGDPDHSGWITPPKGQGSCQFCWAFAAVNAAESRANILYNTHDPGLKNHLDLNLSELQVIRCHGTNPGHHECIQYNPNAAWGFIGTDALLYMSVKYTDNETCFPYANAPQNPSCLDPAVHCQYPEYQAKIEDYEPVMNSSSTADDIKTALITEGPLPLVVYIPPNQTYYKHAMLLIGFGVNKANDTLYKGTGENDPDIVIEPGSDLINTIKWIFKDSSSPDNSGYREIDGGLENFYKPDCHQLLGEVSRKIAGVETPIQHQCADEDGDGYYWWGIDPDPAHCGCPDGVLADKEDCNDNDNTSGPYVLDPSSMERYSCSPNECITSEIPYNVDPDGETWTVEEGDQHFNQNIFIPSGSILEINCQVFFTPDVKIIVQPGGTLILNGTADSPAKLSSGCGQFWKGIEIHGDPSLPQTSQNQGQVVINNGIIENAICGIRTGNTDYTPEGGGQGVPSPVRPSGGIINAQDATFRNNIIGIEFHPYRDGLQDNESHLHKCTFITDDTLFNEVIPQALLKLDGINKLEILGCEFRNSREMNGLASYDQRGKGIFCYNSEAYLNSKSTSDCKFEQLERGVYALHSGLGHSSISISNTHFLNNQYGMYISGFQETNPVSIMNNTFSYLHNISNSIQYGLYFDNSSGYKVELNTLSGSYFAGGTQYGILINNSGVRTNYIYNNDFSNLKFALQSQNLNRGIYWPDNGKPSPEPSPETGLCFKCNNFIDCVNDIIVEADDEEINPESGIVKFQGNDFGKNSPTAKTEPAGNLFSSIIPQQHLFDINMGDVISHSIIYTHHIDDQYYHLIPEIQNHVNNPDLVSLHRHSSDYAVYYPDPNNGSCPDEFPTENVDSLITLIHQAKENIDSIITLLSLFVDDGDTEEKNAMVLNSEPDKAMEVYADLINTSPYLSDTVLSSSASKEEVLSNIMITDIMAANPQSAKNEIILTALEERVNPLTEAMWSEVLGGIDTLAAREILESNLAGWIQLKEYCINNLIQIYLTDSITQWNPDSCRILLSNDHALSSQFSLVSHLLDNAFNSSADSLLNAIQYEYPLSSKEDSIREQFLQLNPILDVLFVDSIGNVMPDSVQQIVLQQLSLHDHTIPGAYARNILIASGLLNYTEPILSPSELKSSRRFRSQEQSEELLDRFKIYPNPCKSYLLIEIKDIIQDLPDEVAIYSINNQLIYKSSISSFQHVSTVPLENIESGVYLLQLLQSGKVIESKKILHIN